MLLIAQLYMVWIGKIILVLLVLTVIIVLLLERNVFYIDSPEIRIKVLHTGSLVLILATITKGVEVFTASTLYQKYG